MTWVLVAAAVALLLWPSKPVGPLSKPFKPSSPDYLEAVRCVQVVTKRLSETGQLKEAERKALDTLVLALSAGSAE